MFGNERCEMTKKMKDGINSMFKEIVALDGLPIADFIGTDPKAMLVLGYCTKLLDYSFEMLDDAYGFMNQQKEVNKELLNELEKVNKKLEYQETLIRDLKKTTRSKEDNKE